MPPPQPVPRMTPNTTPYPAPAPSLASLSAKQLASFSTRTSRASAGADVAVEAVAVQRDGVGVLDQAGGRADDAGDADADGRGHAELRLGVADQAGDRVQRVGDSRAGVAMRWRSTSCRPGPRTAISILVPPRSMPISMPCHDAARCRAATPFSSGLVEFRRAMMPRAGADSLYGQVQRFLAHRSPAPPGPDDAGAYRLMLPPRVPQLIAIADALRQCVAARCHALISSRHCDGCPAVMPAGRLATQMRTRTCSKTTSSSAPAKARDICTCPWPTATD